jgi:hypothetical protein
MARTLTKHVARRQEQTFADWFAELRELAGERWPDVADQGTYRLRGLGRRRDTAAGALHGGTHSPAQGRRIITNPSLIPGEGFL